MDQPRNFHQASWHEPIILEMTNPGERGVLLPPVEPEIENSVGDVLATIPENLRRYAPPKLPELSQPQVLRHYLRLSQETIGMDMTIDIGQGTSTMKHSPKVNEHLARLPQMADLHPLQDASTAQGILEVMYRFEQILKRVSGLDRFSFQPAGGAQAVYANACILRAYHAARGQADPRDEIITTIFSHPVDAASPKTAGYKIITLYPGENGYVELDALKAALSERTAGLVVTNPEDTGIYNPHIDEFVRLVHQAGGLCILDQANANGVLGIARAREAGFDMCHFNLHKSFATPHGSRGPGTGAIGVTHALAKYLPVPLVDFDGEKYSLNYDLPDSIGKVRGYYGVPSVVLKAYCWAITLGAEGLREVAEIAVLNHLYLRKKLSTVPGLSMAFPQNDQRLAEARYSWQKLYEDTGIGTSDLLRRVVDFGLPNYFTSHHPWVVPQPSQFEPTESFSKADIDEFVAILNRVATEAYETPNVVKTAPHNSTIHQVDLSPADDPARWAITWRAYLRKYRKTNDD